MTMWEKIWLLGVTAFIVISSGLVGLWGYLQANEVCQSRIVIDAASFTARLETISRNGRVRECGREALVQGNSRRQSEILRKMAKDTYKIRGAYSPHGIVRAGENASMAHVVENFAIPAESAFHNYDIEVECANGNRITMPCWGWGETWNTTIVSLYIQNPRRISQLLQVLEEPVRLNGSAAWVAWLKEHGVDRINAGPANEGGSVDSKREDVIFMLKGSGHTRVGEFLQVWSALKKAGVHPQNIRFAQLKDEYVEDPAVPEQAVGLEAAAEPPGLTADPAGGGPGR